MLNCTFLLVSEYAVHVLRWLSAIDQSAIDEKEFAKREPGTGSWLFNSSEFKSWLSQPSSLLWLHGGGMIIIYVYLVINLMNMHSWLWKTRSMLCQHSKSPVLWRHSYKLEAMLLLFLFSGPVSPTTVLSATNSHPPVLHYELDSFTNRDSILRMWQSSPSTSTNGW